MKAIKFRQRLKSHFWHNDEKFHYWGYIGDSFVSPMGKNETVGDSEQFTGLKDKNDTDIYEGDVVDGVTHSDHTVHVGRVLYDYSGYRVLTKTRSLTLDFTEILSVISSIHENKDLLS